MRRFDHVGIPTTEVKPGERYVAQTKVFVTDPKTHPFLIEHLRYDENSPVQDKLKKGWHIAFKVDCIEEESKGLKAMIEPFHSVAGHRVGFYETDDGVVIELMEYHDSSE